MYLNCITFTHNKLIDQRLSLSKVVQPQQNIIDFSSQYSATRVVITYIVLHRIFHSTAYHYIRYLLHRVI